MRASPKGSIVSITEMALLDFKCIGISNSESVAFRHVSNLQPEMWWTLDRYIQNATLGPEADPERLLLLHGREVNYSRQPMQTRQNLAIYPRKRGDGSSNLVV